MSRRDGLLWGVWMLAWKDWGMNGLDPAVFRTRAEAEQWQYNNARNAPGHTVSRVARLVPQWPSRPA